MIEVPPEPPLLHVEQPHLSQPLLLVKGAPVPSSFWCPSLDSFVSIYCFSLGMAEFSAFFSTCKMPLIFRVKGDTNVISWSANGTGMPCGLVHLACLVEELNHYHATVCYWIFTASSSESSSAEETSITL